MRRRDFLRGAVAGLLGCAVPGGGLLVDGAHARPSPPTLTMVIWSHGAQTAEGFVAAMRAVRPPFEIPPLPVDEYSDDEARRFIAAMGAAARRLGLC